MVHRPAGGGYFGSRASCRDCATTAPVESTTMILLEHPGPTCTSTPRTAASPGPPPQIGGQLHRRRPPEHPEIHHHRRRRIGPPGPRNRGPARRHQAWPSRRSAPHRSARRIAGNDSGSSTMSRAGPKCTMSRIGASSTVSPPTVVRPVPRRDRWARDGSVPLTCVGQRHRRGHHRPAALTDVHREHRHRATVLAHRHVDVDDSGLGAAR